ncbi:MAG: hypothetical protein M3R67_14010, partial [Acidobacteriota bacterium]|nr:hypothetical protein [Acidobacteriota bacterium]
GRLAKRAKAALENAAIDLIADAQCKAKLHIADGARSLGWKNLQSHLEESAKRHSNFETASNALKNNRPPADKVPIVPSPTNNYHQVRIGGALAGIESLALLGKIPSFKEVGFNIATAEAFASALSIFAIVADMMYAYTKSVRELPNYAAIDGVKNGADIVRGGFKLTAGLLASVAGGITAYSDWRKFEKEPDPIISAILFSRSLTGGLSSGAGLLATYSYCGPLLKPLAERRGRLQIATKIHTLGKR